MMMPHHFHLPVFALLLAVPAGAWVAPAAVVQSRCNHVGFSRSAPKARNGAAPASEKADVALPNSSSKPLGLGNAAVSRTARRVALPLVALPLAARLTAAPAWAAAAATESGNSNAAWGLVQGLGSSVTGATSSVFSALSVVSQTELFTYFVKTVVAWSVPAVVLGLLVAAVADSFKGELDEDEKKFFGALGKVLGDRDALPKPQKKSFGITVTRLNDRYASVGDLFDEAYHGKEAARAKQSTRYLEEALQQATVGLSARDTDAVKELVNDYTPRARELKNRLNTMSKAMRKKALAVTSKDKTLPSAKDEDEGWIEIVGSSKVEKMQIERQFKGLRRKKKSQVWGSPAGGYLLRDDKYLETFEEKAALELKLWEELSDILPKAPRLALFEALEKNAEVGSSTYSPLSDGSSSSSALSTKQDLGRVFHLIFKGDVQCSQVDQLRQEVSAVILNSQQGDRVVLELDSGGGTVTGYGFAAAQLQRLKAAGLHLTVCVTEVAASGGYMMASVADEIVAGPLACLGSIGVVTQIPNVYERLAKEGIVVNTLTAGLYKRTLTLTGKVEQKDIDKTKEDLEGILELFREFVRSNRPDLDVDKVATGEVWFGPQALALHLCDKLATTDDVLLGYVKDGHQVYSIASGPTESSFPLLSLAQAEAALTNRGIGGGGGVGGKLLQKLTGALTGGGGNSNGNGVGRVGVQQDATMAEASLLMSSLMNQQQQQMGGAPGSSSQWRMQQTQPMPMVTSAEDAEAYAGGLNGKDAKWN